MTTWEQGREILAKQIGAITTRLDAFQDMLVKAPPLRTSGLAVFLTRSVDTVPVALTHNLRHNKTIHSEVVILSIRTEETLRQPDSEKIEVAMLGRGVYRMVARFGFMESPRIGTIFALARDKGSIWTCGKPAFSLTAKGSPWASTRG